MKNGFEIKKLNGLCLNFWPKKFSPEESKIGYINDEKVGLYIWKDDLEYSPSIRIYNNQ